MSARLHPVVSSRAARADARASGAHLRDAILVAGITVAAAALCAHFNVTEKLRHLTAPYEWLQLDELPSVVLVLAVGLAWFAGRRHREARREIARRTAVESQLAASLADNRRLAQQYVQLQEAQRKSLARELHDELGQYLNVIKLDAVGIRDDRLADPEAVHARARAMVENCNHIHGALATLLRELRPVGLDELGLAAALEHCVDTWRARLPGVVLDLAVTGDFTTLPEGLAVTVYRLVQEALTNVATHAAAHRVIVRLDRTGFDGAPGESVIAVVEDDGVGTEPELPTRGLGLIGMRERVMALQGELVFKSSPGRGFRLTARIPVQPATGDAL
jgi:two-component system, NarL family, sensor histidine kinase UhpB